MELAATITTTNADPADMWAGPDPVAIADLLLLSALRLQITTIGFEPGDQTTHQITLRRHKQVVRSLSLEHGAGAWVIDRLAFLAGLDLTFPTPATGRCLIQAEGREVELFVAVTPASARIAAEVWLFDRDGAAQPSTPALLPAGFVVGSYRIREVIGEGGMGIVYRADHLVLERTVAIKVLRSRIYREDPTAAEWLLREARAAASIGHPGIVEVYDVATLPDGRPYLVMEILAGGSLEGLIARGGGLDLPRVVAIGIKVAEALGAAHAAGIIHRDLKPSNVFVSDDPEPRVTLVDFGAAMTANGPVADYGNPEIVIGTPYYIAPEHIQGSAPDRRSDLYSLGVLLYESIAGVVPFDGARIREVLLGHLHQPVPDVALARPETPSALAQLVTRLLAKDPTARPASAAEVAVVLRTVARNLASGRRRFWSRR